MQLKIIVVVVTFCLGATANAFESTKVLLNDGASWLNTTQKIFRFDKRWGWEDYVLLAGISSGAFYLQTRKEHIRVKTQKIELPFPTQTLKHAEALGTRWFLPQAAGVLYGTGFLTSLPPLRHAGLLLAESYLLTLATVGLGQMVLAEDRPKDGGEMKYFKMTDAGHGISGHAALSASLSGPLNAVFLQVTPDDSVLTHSLKYFGRAIVYGAPLLTAWHRIHYDKHYLWNVLLGSSLGYSMGEMVGGAYLKKSLNITPKVTLNGLALVYHF